MSRVIWMIASPLVIVVVTWYGPAVLSARAALSTAVFAPAAPDIGAASLHIQGNSVLMLPALRR